MIPTGFLKAWATAAFVILAADAIFLGWLARDFYQSRIGHLMADNVRLWIAAIFYIGYSAAAVILVAGPAAREGNLLMAAALGALLGATAYGTYDVTNMATLKDWPLSVTLVDIAWGTALTATASVAAFLALRTS